MVRGKGTEKETQIYSLSPQELTIVILDKYLISGCFRSHLKHLRQSYIDSLSYRQEYDLFLATGIGKKVHYPEVS